MVWSPLASTVHLAAALLLWLYFTLWIVVSPLVDAGHPVQQWFPQRFWALVVPIVSGVVVLAVALERGVERGERSG
jgi:threonine/homoserine/homoserine lactone efflux protein